MSGGDSTAEPDARSKLSGATIRDWGSVPVLQGSLGWYPLTENEMRCVSPPRQSSICPYPFWTLNFDLAANTFSCDDLGLHPFHMNCTTSDTPAAPDSKAVPTPHAESSSPQQSTSTGDLGSSGSDAQHLGASRYRSNTCPAAIVCSAAVDPSTIAKGSGSHESAPGNGNGIIASKTRKLMSRLISSSSRDIAAGVHKAEAAPGQKVGTVEAELRDDVGDSEDSEGTGLWKAVHVVPKSDAPTGQTRQSVEELESQTAVPTAVEKPAQGLFGTWRKIQSVPEGSGALEEAHPFDRLHTSAPNSMIARQAKKCLETAASIVVTLRKEKLKKSKLVQSHHDIYRSFTVNMETLQGNTENSSGERDDAKGDKDHDDDQDDEENDDDNNSWFEYELCPTDREATTLTSTPLVLQKFAVKSGDAGLLGDGGSDGGHLSCSDIQPGSSEDLSEDVMSRSSSVDRLESTSNSSGAQYSPQHKAVQGPVWGYSFETVRAGLGKIEAYCPMDVKGTVLVKQDFMKT